MRIYELRTEIRVPGRIEDIFPFFADAGNLEKLTPPWLNFEIITPRPIEMGVGALIDYRIWLRIVPMRWRTKITAWDPPHRFVDEQLKGPYRQWIHEHTFEQIGGEVAVRDHVRYAVPGGTLIERAVHAILVKSDVDRIFAYRMEAMRKLL